MNSAFPFSAIVGQDDMKLALTLTAIDPKSGGVLAVGERGRGESAGVGALGVEIVQIPYDKVQLNGGGIHCSTCPLVRDSVG
ncbi:MAG: hypothetical protein VW233_01725 [Paracoccaceae bacterium]